MSHSLLDNDLYKFTMMQAVLHQFPSTDVEYKLIVRSKGVDLREHKKHIESDLDALCDARMSGEELDYLRTIRFFKPDFVNFLEDFRLKRRFVDVYEEKDQLAIRIKGPWVQTILFEVPQLAIISQCYTRQQKYGFNIFQDGEKILNEKLEWFYQAGKPFHFADFGTRRRADKEWHEIVVRTLAQKVPDNFIGTSNLYLAMKYGLKPIGTMAHEWIQAGQGLGHCPLVQSQKYMLEAWSKEYRGDLGIALTDTIGMDAFLRDFDPYLAKLYDGGRHDSNDPIVWGEKMIAHYTKFGIDPTTKSYVFSDNLKFTVDPLRIVNHFSSRVPEKKISFGIGTNLTNDVGIKPLSIVIKLVRVNGNPVAKISDEPEKVICEDGQFLNYLKKVNGLPYGLYRTAEEYAAAELEKGASHD